MVTLQQIPAPQPWEAYLLPVSGFNLPAGESSELLFVIERLRAALIAQKQLEHEAFIQLEQFEEQEARVVFTAHSRDWLPEMGLGVWPHRDPPAVWTKEEFRAAPPGVRVRPLMFQVFQITTSAAARQKAVELLFPFGSMMEIFAPSGTDELFRKTASALLPRIKDPTYSCFPYYIPLLEGSAVTGVTTAQLDTWCSGIDVYIRQSFEDKGVLILARQSILDLFRDIGAIADPDNDALWRFPKRQAA